MQRICTLFFSVLFLVTGYVKGQNPAASTANAKAIAILSMRDGTFGYKDVANNRVEGKQKFECQMTIKGGRIVYDLNALAVSNPRTAGE